MSEVNLATGKSIDSPAVFLNPQKSVDAEVLKRILARYEVEHIAGMTLDIHDLQEINSAIYEDAYIQTSIFEEEFGEGEADDDFYANLRSRVKLINPDMSSLLGYTYGEEMETVLSYELDDGDSLFDVDQDLASIVEQLGGITREGQMRLREGAILPILEQRGVIQNIMEFQIQKGADIVATPSIPITSMREFQSRVNTIGEIFRRGQAIVDGSLLSADVDYMQLLSIDPSVLRAPEDGHTTREEELERVLTSNNPDFLGIHVRELNHEHRDRVSAFLDVIESIADEHETPIIVFNVDEFGLVALERGADCISNPIATNPYPRISAGNSGSSRGSYYHYEDMTGYTRERLMDLTRPDYLFPCPCDICERFERVTAVNTSYWNEFRRVHYTLVKNSEMKRLHESETGLGQALRDMLGNSVRTDLVAYLS